MGGALLAALLVAAPASAQSPPTCATPSTIAVAHGTATYVDLSCSDADNDPMTVRVVQQPRLGSAEQSGSYSSLIYRPRRDASGSDSFTVEVSDGQGGSSQTTVPITLAADSAPRCNDAGIGIDHGDVAHVTLSCSDPDSADTVTPEIVDGPAHGTLSAISGDQITYTPDPDFAGTDTFTYRGRDDDPAQLTSDVRTVSVRVSGAQAPTCQIPETAAVDHATPTAIPLTCLVAGGGTITYTLEAQPASGSATVDTSGIVHFTPSADSGGYDSFWVDASAPGGALRRVNVSVRIDNPPACAATSPVDVAHNGSVTIWVICGDPDQGQTLSYSIADGPQVGFASTSGNAVGYVATRGAAGTDRFNIVVNDGHRGTAIVSQVVTIAPNHAPTCKPEQPGMQAGTSIPVGLSCADPDQADRAVPQVLSNPAHGTLSDPTRDAVTYTPQPGFTGTDTFTYGATDDDPSPLSSDPVTVTVTVDPAPGSAPVVVTVPADVAPVAPVVLSAPALTCLPGPGWHPFAVTDAVLGCEAPDAADGRLTVGAGRTRLLALACSRCSARLVTTLELDRRIVHLDDRVVHPATGGTIVDLSLTHALVRRIARARRASLTAQVVALAGDGRKVRVGRTYRLTPKR